MGLASPSWADWYMRIFGVGGQSPLLIHHIPVAGQRRALSASVVWFPHQPSRQPRQQLVDKLLDVGLQRRLRGSQDQGLLLRSLRHMGQTTYALSPYHPAACVPYILAVQTSSSEALRRTSVADSAAWSLISRICSRWAVRYCACGAGNHRQARLHRESARPGEGGG